LFIPVFADCFLAVAIPLLLLKLLLVVLVLLQIEVLQPKNDVGRF
jgi:hypothetical protein